LATTRPIAVAGSDQTATIGVPTTFDGTGSYDPEGFTIDTYSWFLLYSPPGSTATLINDNTPYPSIIPDVVGSYRVFLVVTAGGRESEPDPLKAPQESFVHAQVLTANNGWVIPARGQKDWDSYLYDILTEIDANIPYILPPEVVIEDDNVTRLGSGTEDSGKVPIADGVGNVNWGHVGGGGGFEILTFSLTGSTLIEVGDTLTDPSFTATYQGTVDTASVIDDQGGASLDVSATPNAFTYSGVYTKNAYGATVRWTLDADDGLGGSDSATETKVWTQKVYWGVGAAGGGGEAFIKALANSALATSRSRTFTVTAGATDKIYYAYRSGYGDATFAVGGFVGGFFKVSDTISVTNSFGFTENYTLYESDNVDLGTTTVVVS